LLIFIYIGVQHREIKRLTKENQLNTVELSTFKDIVAVHESKTGELTYKLSVVEISHSNLKKSLELSGFEIKKLKEKDIAWRKVNSALRMQLAATGTVSANLTDTFRIENTDTVYFSKFEPWSNNFLSIYDGEIVKKKLTFEYGYQTGISIIQEPRRKETIVNVFLTDPKAEITTANSITVKHKKRIWEHGWLWAAIGLTGGILIAK
jgi:hypothetical protein